MRNILLIVMVSMALAACHVPDSKPAYPKICTRAEPLAQERIFIDCLKNSHNSQIIGKYNDSDEVVEQCRYASRDIAPQVNGLRFTEFGDCVLNKSEGENQ